MLAVCKSEVDIVVYTLVRNSIVFRLYRLCESSVNNTCNKPIQDSEEVKAKPV